MIKVWKIFSFLIVLAVCLGLLLVPAMGVFADPPAGKATFQMPAEVRVATDEAFIVNVTIWNPNSEVMTSAGTDLMISDPGMLTITAIDAGDWPTWFPPGWDNTTGESWTNGAGSLAEPNITTDALQCVIHFVAGSSPGVVTVNFNPAGDEGETVIYNPASEDMLDWGTIQNMTVIIGDVFNLTVTSTGCCPINVSGGRGTVANGSSESFVVPCSESVTLTAVDSDPCCDFVSWTGNVSTANNPTTVIGAANESCTATATCSVPQVNLTMAVNGGGTTTPASGTTNPYSCGQNVSITATANASWRFVNWTTPDMNEIVAPTAASTTVTVDKDKTVTANFVEQFNLTMNVTGSGNVTIDGAIPASYPNSTTWDNGDVVNIIATPDPCWDFVNWTGVVADPDSASTSVTMDANKTVTANFVQVNYTLNMTVNGSGNVTINGTTPASYPNITSWVNCTVVNLTATPDDDWAFVNWTGDVADSNSTSTNITVDANKNVTANFGPQDFSVSPTSLTFTTVEGVNPSSKTLEICNTGNGTLNWSLSDGGTGWLSENPVNDSLNETACGNITVSVNVAGMAAGDYDATITINGSAWQKVPVSLHIAAVEEELPEITVLPAGLSASGLSITPQQVQPGQEVTISINVANTGGKTGSYNAVLYINSVVEDSQTVSVAAGTSKNVIFTVSKSEAGVYDVSLAGQSGQFEVVGGGGWFAGGLGTGGIIAIVVVVIVLIVAVIFILRGTARPE